MIYIDFYQTECFKISCLEDKLLIILKGISELDSLLFFAISTKVECMNAEECFRKNSNNGILQTLMFYIHISQPAVT